MTQEQIDLLLEIDFECAKLEDVLHGNEGEIITYVRTLIIYILGKNAK
jgi:hypothetical protein